MLAYTFANCLQHFSRPFRSVNDLRLGIRKRKCVYSTEASPPRPTSSCSFVWSLPCLTLKFALVCGPSRCCFPWRHHRTYPSSYRAARARGCACTVQPRHQIAASAIAVCDLQIYQCVQFGRSTYASPTTDGFRSLIIRHIASCAAGAFTSPSSSA